MRVNTTLSTREMQGQICRRLTISRFGDTVTSTTDKFPHPGSEPENLAEELLEAEYTASPRFQAKPSVSRP